jgi:hypothetical protein
MLRDVAQILFVALTGGRAHAQMLRCTEDSPERHGQPGCSVVADKRLPSLPEQPVLWHIDEFGSFDAAQEAAGSHAETM